MDSNAVQKYRQKELSFKKKDVYIIKDDNDSLPTSKESHYTNELMEKNSIPMYATHIYIFQMKNRP